MSEKLKPCPFCGETPTLYQVDESTWGVECRHHDWSEHDGDGVSCAGDIAVYASARYELDRFEKFEHYVDASTLEAARRKAAAVWNRRADKSVERWVKLAKEER